MSSSAGRSEAEKSSALTIVSGATMLALIIFTVPLTTLVPSADALNADAGLQAWILSGMPLGAAAGLLGAGALGDMRSRRTVFLVGLLIVTIASLVGASATTGLVLVIGRVAQGLGCAAVLSCGLGLLGQVYTNNDERIRSTGIWAAALGAGVATGPMLAAFLTRLGGWQLTYIVDGVLALLLFLFGRTRLPETAFTNNSQFDWLGATLLLIAMALLMSGMTELRFGWDRPATLILLGVGSALIVIFIVVESRHKQPVLDLSLFQSPDFVGATVAAFASGAGVLALMTLVPTLLQRALDIGAVWAALILMAWSVTSIITALVAKWLLLKMTPRALLSWGLVLCGFAQFLLYKPQLEHLMLQFMPALFLAGAANGVLNAALGKQAVASVSVSKTAMGSGANNTARYLGSAIGITLGAVLIAHGQEVDATEGLVHGWNQTVILTVVFSLCGAVIVAFAREKKGRRESASDVSK